MSNFRPCAKGYNPNGAGESVLEATITKPTYRELMKEVRKWLKKREYTHVAVFRSRRGEWGEWFEKWTTCGKKVIKTKEGWS